MYQLFSRKRVLFPCKVANSCVKLNKQNIDGLAQECGNTSAWALKWSDIYANPYIYNAMWNYVILSYLEYLPKRRWSIISRHRSKLFLRVEAFKKIENDFLFLVFEHYTNELSSFLLILA